MIMLILAKVMGEDEHHQETVLWPEPWGIAFVGISWI